MYVNRAFVVFCPAREKGKVRIIRITVEILSLPGKIHENVATFSYMILKLA